MNRKAITKTVLVVDDVADNIEILGRILASEYRVKVAKSGREALQVIDSASPPDLVLLDIMMPDMDGFAVCRAIKGSPATYKIPVIFVTAKNEDYDEAQGFEAGGVDYITKPISPLVVQARVRTHLALHDAMSDLERQNEILQENLRLREDVDRITRHDLKSPLSGIGSLLSMMAQDAGLSQDNQDCVEAMRLTVLRLQEMINRSLDLYRMERGTYALHKAPIELLDIIRQVFSDLQPLAGLRHRNFLLDIDGGETAPHAPVIVEAEEYLCYAMLSNLVKNAVEASPDGMEVQVLIRTGPTLRIEILNQGEIPLAIRDRFFSMYATSGKQGGTGLGAYSARLMARTMGGDITFDSSSEEGTRLTVTLPGPVRRGRKPA